MKTISVAIPCYRSSTTIRAVVEEIVQTIKDKKGYDYQIILVNDYPYDQTFDTIRELCKLDDRIIGVNLSKNYGQTAAKLAAIDYFDGDMLVYMDDDGQHPANQLFKLVEKIEEGYDSVFAYFPHKKHSLFKRVTSNLNSKIQEWNGAKPKGVKISSFHALSRFAALELKEYKSPFPSLGGYINTITSKATNVELEHRERLEGHSNYTLKKLLRLWLTNFTNFSLVPLRCVAFIGSVFAIGGFIAALVMIIRKLINPHILIGYTSNMAIQFLIGGLILISLGLIGEYIGRIYMTVSNLRPYSVREEVNQKGK